MDASKLYYDPVSCRFFTANQERIDEINRQLGELVETKPSVITANDVYGIIGIPKLLYDVVLWKWNPTTNDYDFVGED